MSSGRQARRALTSIHLNVAEAKDAEGGNRRLRFRTALGSTNEVIACLEVAHALGYVTFEPADVDALQHTRAILVNLLRPKR